MDASLSMAYEVSLSISADKLLTSICEQLLSSNWNFPVIDIIIEMYIQVWILQLNLLFKIFGKVVSVFKP